MSTLDILLKLALSLALGLLVGLQRERKADEIAGIRTFALITLLGTLSALLAEKSPWVLPAAALSLTLLIATGAFLKARTPRPGNSNHLAIGLTTEIAALLMFALGAYLLHGETQIALVLGGSVALLLHAKPILHTFVRKLGDKDVTAIMQFVLIVLVILPILPDEKYGPYGFFNPFETWLVVVLVVAMSLAGYVLYKLVPPSVGTLLGGAVGGLVSSTATTVSYARRSKDTPAAAPLAAQAIMIANTVSLLRVMALLLIITGPAAAWPILQPLLLLAAAMALLSAFSFFRRPKPNGKVAKTKAKNKEESKNDNKTADNKADNQNDTDPENENNPPAALPEQSNPTELRSALLFAAIYSLVKLAIAWSQSKFAESALYAIAFISGLTDLDAITLSIAQSTQKNTLAAAIAWRAILIAIVANLIFKAATIYTLAHPKLKSQITLLFTLTLTAAAALFFLWK